MKEPLLGIGIQMMPYLSGKGKVLRRFEVVEKRMVIQIFILFQLNVCFSIAFLFVRFMFKVRIKVTNILFIMK